VRTHQWRLRPPAQIAGALLHSTLTRVHMANPSVLGFTGEGRADAAKWVIAAAKISKPWSNCKRRSAVVDTGSVVCQLV